MSDSSWKKPEDVMRLMREKKRALQVRFRSSEVSSSVIGVDSNSDSFTNSNPKPASTTAIKRKNPFRRSPSKKQKLQENCQQDFARSDSVPTPDTVEQDTLFKLLHLSTPVPADKKEDIPHPLPDAFTSTVEKKKSQGKCIVDWSLKTRVRFTSKTKFAFSSTLKTSEEASGITSFVRCVNHGSSEDSSTLDTSTNAQFHQCCLLWQYPWLPWLSLFPRDSRTPVTSTTGSINIGLDPNISSSMINDWCESFRSLFGLLRARQCPYFYVCTHQFNVLFRAAGIGGVPETHALMTPTTRGLRDILRRDDIKFSMPLRNSGPTDPTAQQQSTASNSDKKASDDPDDDDGEDEDDDNEDEWINEIGLHSNLRSKLEAERLQDGGQGTSEGSYHDSLILIEDAETQGLFNWLMNSKLCLSSTGPLAGIPPTLLSPVSFHGATLRPLKVRQGLLKQGGENVYSLEVQGPVLPHCVVSLMTLLQSGDYKAIFSVVGSTKPFSVFQSLNPPASAFGKESLSDCGLDAGALDLFCSSQPFPAANEIRHEDDVFYFDS